METTAGRTEDLGMLQVTIAPQSTSTAMFQHLAKEVISGCL